MLKNGAASVISSSDTVKGSFSIYLLEKHLVWRRGPPSSHFLPSLKQEIRLSSEPLIASLRAQGTSLKMVLFHWITLSMILAPTQQLTFVALISCYLQR